MHAGAVFRTRRRWASLLAGPGLFLGASTLSLEGLSRRVSCGLLVLLLCRAKGAVSCLDVTSAPCDALTANDVDWALHRSGVARRNADGSGQQGLEARSSCGAPMCACRGHCTLAPSRYVGPGMAGRFVTLRERMLRRAAGHSPWTCVFIQPRACLRQRVDAPEPSLLQHMRPWEAFHFQCMVGALLRAYEQGPHTPTSLLP